MTNSNELKAAWKAEETKGLTGWDFTYLDNRWKSGDIPWDYRSVVMDSKKEEDRLLDMGTGGGEFLLTLNHPHNLTSVTEGYAPNVRLCLDRLAPLGITVRQVRDGVLPFEEESFDLVINRHEDYREEQVGRVRKKEGLFITQQVGGRNNLPLSRLLIRDFTPQYPDSNLETAVRRLEKCGFKILESREAFIPLEFLDVEALVWYAKAIPWEFPGFSVDSCFEQLLKARKIIETEGAVRSMQHRFLIAARKI